MDSITLGNILYIGRAFNNYRRELRLPDSLMPPEMLFISYIYRHQGCTQDQIVKSAGMDKTTVAHRLARLENLGYIRRKISAEDARKKLCYPTEKADSVYPQIHEQYLQFWQQLMVGFSEEELLLLEQMTVRMKDNAEHLLSQQMTTQKKDNAEYLLPEQMTTRMKDNAEHLIAGQECRGKTEKSLCRKDLPQ